MVVVGLGRFSTSLALELVKRDIDVLGIDRSPKIVQSLAGSPTQVVAAHSTDAEAMEQLGVPEFSRAWS